MISLVLYVCTNAYHTDCMIQYQVDMPTSMPMQLQIQECKRRMSATEWMLTSNRFFSCETTGERVQM